MCKKRPFSSVFEKNTLLLNKRKKEALLPHIKKTLIPNVQKNKTVLLNMQNKRVTIRYAVSGGGGGGYEAKSAEVHIKLSFS